MPYLHSPEDLGELIGEVRAEQAVLTRIEELSDNGASLRDIAALLNTEGGALKKGKPLAPSDIGLRDRRPKNSQTATDRSDES